MQFTANLQSFLDLIRLPSFNGCVVAIASDSTQQRIALAILTEGLKLLWRQPATVQHSGEFIAHLPELKKAVGKSQECHFTLLEKSLQLTKTQQRSPALLKPVELNPKIRQLFSSYIHWTPPGTVLLNWDMQQFKEGLKRTQFAASGDKRDRIYREINISTQKTGIRFAATDSHRLTLYTAPLPTPAGVSIQFTTDGCVSALMCLLASVEPHSWKSEIIEPGYAPQLCFTTQIGEAKLELLCDSYKGTYPNLDQLIFTKHSHTAVFEKAALQNILEEAITQGEVVSLHIHREYCNGFVYESNETYYTSDPIANWQIPLHNHEGWKGEEPKEIPISVNYLLQGVDAISDSSVVKLHYRSNPCPILITEPDVQWQYMIMPIATRARKVPLTIH